MKGMLHGYASIFNLGHAAVADIFDGNVMITEKVDGSQFSFGLINGEFVCRSKGKDQTPPITDKMFDLAVKHTSTLDLHPNWVYRGEFLASKPSGVKLTCADCDELGLGKVNDMQAKLLKQLDVSPPIPFNAAGLAVPVEPISFEGEMIWWRKISIDPVTAELLLRDDLRELGEQCFNENLLETGMGVYALRAVHKTSTVRENKFTVPLDNVTGSPSLGLAESSSLLISPNTSLDSNIGGDSSALVPAVSRKLSPSLSVRTSQAFADLGAHLRFVKCDLQRLSSGGNPNVSFLGESLTPAFAFLCSHLRLNYITNKHNALAYERVPTNHVVIFDIDAGLENYLPYDEMVTECQRIGLEPVPLLLPWSRWEDGWEKLRAFLQVKSFLGGQTIEGMVIKAYGRYGADKKTLMAKYVSEAFKEVHDREWKKSNPGGKDVVQTLIERLHTEARWHKAIQHLRDNGELTMTPQDIGPLLREVQADVEREERARIEAALFSWAWQKISRAVIAGLPEFYKEWLAEQQFEEKE